MEGANVAAALDKRDDRPLAGRAMTATFGRLDGLTLSSARGASLPAHYPK